MIVAMDANKITILMRLSIMQESKNFKSNKLLRIFGRSNSISKTFVKYMNQLDEWILDKCEKLSIAVYMSIMNCKAVGTKYSRNNRENFRGIL